MLIVKKFGGTSVGTIERIEHVAQIIKRSYGKEKICMVVSAMAGETDRLVGLYKQISSDTNTNEYDLLLASGEQASVALVSAFLNKVGVKAKPLLGFQAGFKTDSYAGKAKIVDIRSDAVHELIEQNIVPVIAGFQGIDEKGHITTLGRGGSDTSAVAIAVALKANKCQIFTDVSGVFTADPRIVKKAKKIPRLSFEEMLELASLGAKVLHPRCVELGAKYKMPIEVLSSFEEEEGTMIDQEFMAMESAVVTAITSDHNASLITIKNLSQSHSLLSDIFLMLSEQGINVDIIVHSAPREDHSIDLSFTIPNEDILKLQKVLKSYKFTAESGLSKISLIGSGMRSHPGVAARMFKVLGELKIPILCTSTSDIKISCMVPGVHIPNAINRLHSEFKLSDS